MNGENVIKEKSYAFALRLIKAYKFLSAEQRKSILSKQLPRSGTTIGTLIHEAQIVNY